MSAEKSTDLVPVNGDTVAPSSAPHDLAGVLFKAGPPAVCSFNLATAEGRELMQKCEEAPDEPVRELSNKRINLKHVYARPIDLVDKETGEVRPVLRICLIDADGSVHGCCSDGIRQALGRLIAGHGMPPWKTPIPVEVKLKGLGNSRQRLTLLEVFDQKKGGAK